MDIEWDDKTIQHNISFKTWFQHELIHPKLSIKKTCIFQKYKVFGIAFKNQENIPYFYTQHTETNIKNILTALEMLTISKG